MSAPASIHMGSADAAWLRMDGPANPMVINSLIRFEEPLDADLLREVLLRRLLEPYPKFGMRVSPGRVPLVGSLPRIAPLPAVGPAWTPDPRFAIERHLHRLALPRPGGQDQLLELVGDLVSTPLPDDRPPWQIDLIECDGQSTALLVRMHHCIADGIALAQVLLSLTDGEGEVAAAPETGSEPFDHGGGVGRQIASLALHPRRLAAFARDSVSEVDTLAKLLMLPNESGGTRLSGVRRVGISPPVELELVKAAAHRRHATVNDVLLAAVAGAMRAQARGNDAGAGDEIAPMTAIVPFNLRAPTEPLPPELGNRFGLVFLRMPVQEPDRRRRLAIVKDRMDAIKRSPEGPLTYAVLQAVGTVPAAVEQRLVDLFSAKGTAVITNVPGPSRPRRLAGARVRDLAIWAPASGSVGMSISLFSYRGQVSVGLLADTAVQQHPQALADAIAREIHALAPAARRAA